MPPNEKDQLGKGMTRDTPTWRCIGPDPQWCAQLQPLLPGMGQALGLAADFSQVTILADETAEEEACWFRAIPVLEDGVFGPALELYCSTRSFARHQPVQSTVFPSREVWDAQEGVWEGDSFDPLDFSIARAEMFLYHNLLLAQDLVREVVSLSTIPVGQIEAFTATWEVVVDGRLSRAGWPGYSLADRRGKFSRLFSSAGVLMPHHWQIFQSLWDGGLPTGRDVLGIIRQLPRL